MLAPLLALATAAAAPLPVDVYLVRLEDTEPCEESCWQSLEKKVKGRAGVKKTSMADGALKVSVTAKGFKPDKLLNGLDGFKVEMRAGYAGAEVRIEPDAFFPPVVRPELTMVVLPVGPDVQAVVEEATGFKLQPRMKCVGKVATPSSGELFLSRFTSEGLAPHTYLPFAAMPDFDGDGKRDLYLRLVGMPELFVFGKAGALKARSLGDRNPDEIVRCELNPERFVRVVPKAKIKCASGKPRPVGDAVERVVWNESAELVFFDGSKIVTCQPASVGEDAAEGFESPTKKKDKVHTIKGSHEE